MSAKVILVIVLCVISFTALAAFFVMIGLNIGSDRVLSPVAKVAAALLAAVVFFSLDLVAEDDREEFKINVLSIYSRSGEPWSMSGPLTLMDSEKGGGFRFVSMAVAMYPYSLVVPNYNDFDVLPVAFENMESALWLWLTENYSIHWDIQRDWFQSLGSGGGSTRAAEGSEKQPTRVDVSSHLQDISSRFASAQSRVVALPRGSTLTVERSPGSTTITVDNSWAEIVVRLRQSGAGVISGTRLGTKLMSRFDEPKDWISVTHQIEIRARYKRLRKWSAPTARQKAWVNEISSTLAQGFGWEEIRGDFERGLDHLAEHWPTNTAPPPR